MAVCKKYRLAYISSLITILSFFNIPCFSNGLLDTIKHTPKTSLGALFKRVVSQKENDFKSLSSANKHLLLATRWTNNINKGWISDFPNSVSSNLSGIPIIDFHTSLANAIKTTKSHGWKAFLTLKKPQNFTDIQNYDKMADRKEKGCFLNGHFLTLEGFTQFPKVMVTLSTRSNGKKAHEWFLPIEQAFLCPTLMDYRNSVAVLKDWDNYSHFGLTVIPTNAFVSLRIGIVAPQSLPALNNLYKTTLVKTKIDDVDSRTIKIRNTFNNDAYFFYETLNGGATQFLFAYAYSDSKNRNVKLDNKDDKIYREIKPIEVLEVSKALYKPDQYRFNNSFDTTGVYAEKKITSGGVGEWDNTLQKTHFRDNDYDKLQIGLHVALRESGIISADEYEDIEKIISELRC